MQISHSEQINATFEILWILLLDKVQHPDNTIKEITHVEVLQKYDDGILRQMHTLGMTIRERITIDEQNKIIRFDLIENPMFTGYFINKIEDSDEKLTLIYEQNWIPITPQARELETKFPQILIKGVQEMKELAEKQ
ncbi:hypothetical protein NMSP_1000 [Candidatus Nitrosomarinus catalina]|uniref:Polyketide cyclase / dehydrase and lipid transport n=1 Tax=Candidatus Nitrosomarinus catalinensis TaxID=1898749 RepID=A0A2Z2HKT3_9ARCH|nr:AtaL-like protein [Candidatus Nitrosomarinus catalina]ARS64618.1 hypothetical protein NMSP_1000 [Candidatus Nitrosomarinus catalina]